MPELINANPTVLSASAIPSRVVKSSQDPFHDLLTSCTSPEGHVNDPTEDEEPERFDAQEIYGMPILDILTSDLLSSISDPEHPLTLSQLAVVQLPHITVKDDPSSPMSHVLVEITPTIPHCSMATLIGLCIRVRLERALPQRFRVDIRVRPGTHQSENQVNRQLNDKERVAAAVENEALLKVLHGMLSSCA
jgi:metal-sulfur cluster biosynthetic enzyme